MVKVAVVGTAGYAARETIELLLGHTEAEIVSLVSDSNPEGTIVSDIWPRFRGQLDHKTSKAVDTSCDIAIIAKPTRASQEHALELHLSGVFVIDLSASFRLKDVTQFETTYKESHLCPELIPEAVYGLSEIHRDEIGGTALVANPGCYPVSVILACKPLLESGIIHPIDIVADSYSGISGAGRNVSDETYLFVERDENITPYQVMEHRHAPEMDQELSLLARENALTTFVPHLAPIVRGIMTTIYAKPVSNKNINTRSLRALYESTYSDEPFIRLMPEGNPPSVANVAGTNFCDIGVFYSEPHARIVVLSAIDNLIKGAAGQAIQNMNIMFGLDETVGLI